LEKTLVAWWSYGKEHVGDDLRLNSPEVIASHLDAKIAAFCATPGDKWRWWQVDDDLLVERPKPDSRWCGPDTRIYYLVKRGLGIIENIHYPPPDDRWKWYIHLADIFYDSSRECWIMKDLFTDILVGDDNRTCRVVDLDDLAEALDLGLLTPAQASDVLRRTDLTLAAIAKAAFPFPEIGRGRAAGRELGW
jgi:hypothetical protein